ncbi:hypothetical protein DV737_g3040, partial [Chaetothyriales sp. CBS 132003]
MSILPLPRTVRAQLRSSIQISTLIDVVEELVRNSLDAAATAVEIEVDFSKGYCSLLDDGLGIPANEFREGGNLAQLGWALSRQQSVGDDDYLANRGTRVVVHNLFGNLPVRFKHFALRYAQSNEERRAFRALERRLVGYLLASTRPIHMRLRHRNGNLVYTHQAAHSIDRTPPSPFALGAIESIFKQAGLVPRSGSAAWKLASAQAGGISVHAAICLLPSPSKHGQFIAIGHQPLSDSGHLSCLYDAINQLFDLSEFGALLDGESKTTRLEARQVPEYRQARFKHKMAKGVDRWPRFYVRIDVKSSTVADEFCDAEADASQIPTPIMAVVELLKSLFTTFLQSQNLKPKVQRSQRTDRSQSQPARSTYKLPASSLFDNWKRVKYSAEYEDPGIKHRMPFHNADGPSVSGIVLGKDVRLLLGDNELDSDATPPLDNDSGGRIAPAPSSSEDHWPTMVHQSTREQPIHSAHLHNDVQCGRTEPFSEPAANLDIAAKDLANATVLGQIDAKFILAVVRQDDGAPALLMIDQHAADERIKVEQLFLHLCTPEAVELVVPLTFEVTAEEHNRLLELQDYFASWAIGYDIDRSKETISVTRLPAMVAERCRLEPRLLIELPVLSVGLSSGHVYTYRLPSIGSGDDTVDSVTKQIHEPVVNGHGRGAHEHELGPPPIISSIRRSSTASENGLGSIEEMWKTRRHKGSCRALAFNHDGSMSYSAGTDGLVKAYDTATGRVAWKIALPEIDEDAPSSMYALSPQALLLGTDEGKVYVYDLREAAGAKPSHEWAPHGSEPGLKKGGTSVGEKLVVGQADGVISLWERGVWGDLDERIVIDRAGEGVDSLCEVPEGFGKEKLRRTDEKIVATGLASGHIHFARIGRNRVLHSWEIVHDEIEGVIALGFDVGRRLVSGGGQTIKIWTEAKGRPGGGSEDEKPSKRKKRKRNKGKDRSGGIALTFSGVF